MISIRHQQPGLLTVLLLAGLLLAGRAALAAHTYEHDLGEAHTECAICEFGQAFKDELVSSVESSQITVLHEARRVSGDVAIITPRRNPYPARAPPHPTP